MKKIFTLLCTAVALLGYSSAQAQSFTMERDTVFFTCTSATLQNIYDTVAPASGPVTVKWNVVGTNFPADWQAVSGICDNNNCFNLSGAGGLWPAGTIKTSMAYPVAGANHDFHLQFNASGITSSGTYYVRTRLYNSSTLGDTTYATFVVTANAPNGVTNISRSNEELSLYPNPATTEINLVYGGSADVKTVSIYNIIGKLMSVYRISGNSANMSLENMPGGIYFVRLADAQGQIVATRKFTKQ